MSQRLEQLVIDAARERRDALAVQDHEAAWTYGELDGASDHFAARLQALGVQPGDRVAVWAPKSRWVIAALQGVLRAGAAYVPIDPATPAARARKMLEDCDVRLIATTCRMEPSLGGGRCTIRIDEPDTWSAFDGDQRPRHGFGTEDDLAYILYTSGSTGTPKGVSISHRNALAFIEWAVRETGIKGPQVFANHASLNFDLSVFDLYGAFLSRGTVCLVPDAISYSAAKLVHWMKTNRISVWYSVPSVLVLMMDFGGLFASAGGPSPSIVVFAGEPFPARYLRELRRRWPLARMFNFYGPTETNVCTSYEVVDIADDQVEPVPIGSAASGDRVWAVKDDGSLAGIGEPGELYVDGPTVMIGYWGYERHVGPYRTGDICARRADGNYAFIGRRDHMIKCRGHRVEPGEIEAALSLHPNVREIAVAAVGEGIDQRLVAFVAPRNGAAPTLLDLKSFGATRLPRYMLVDQVEPIESLPRTLNGKVDRRALVANVQ